jgi:hypothetical protein
MQLFIVFLAFVFGFELSIIPVIEFKGNQCLLETGNKQTDLNKTLSFHILLSRGLNRICILHYIDTEIILTSPNRKLETNFEQKQ